MTIGPTHEHSQPGFKACLLRSLPMLGAMSSASVTETLIGEHVCVTGTRMQEWMVWSADQFRSQSDGCYEFIFSHESFQGALSKIEGTLRSDNLIIVYSDTLFARSIYVRNCPLGALVIEMENIYRSVSDKLLIFINRNIEWQISKTSISHALLDKHGQKTQKSKTSALYDIPLPVDNNLALAVFSNLLLIFQQDFLASKKFTAQNFIFLSESAKPSTILKLTDFFLAAGFWKIKKEKTDKYLEIVK